LYPWSLVPVASMLTTRPAEAVLTVTNKPLQIPLIAYCHSDSMVIANHLAPTHFLL
jgi:hypothetical protein